MNNKSIRKLCFAGLLVAVAVIGSLLVIPVFGAKCSPVQHMVNVTAAVLLGPGYALGMGFAAALIRNLLGLGTLAGVSRFDDWCAVERPCLPDFSQAFRRLCRRGVWYGRIGRDSVLSGSPLC